MTLSFGVLIPSTNTTAEIEYRQLPTSYQPHFARLLTSTPGRPFAPSRDEDIDYQSRLLGTAKVVLGWPLQIASFAAMAWLLSRNHTPLESDPNPA